MIRLSAGYSKNVPVDGVEYSSKQYSAHVEVEAADSASEAVIKAKLDLIYAVLEETVEQKLAGTKTQAAQGNGLARQAQKTNGRATDAQQRAIFAIARSLKMESPELEAILRDRYDAGDPSELTLSEASGLIDWLKSRRPGQHADPYSYLAAGQVQRTGALATLFWICSAVVVLVRILGFSL